MLITRFILFFLLFQQLIIAQEFGYTNITTDDGLPSSEVYDIVFAHIIKKAKTTHCL